MNFLELVKNRYSCRAYKALSVEREKLDYILECVRLAPSAVNKQPWRFHIVSKEEDKVRLQQCYNRDWFKTARCTSLLPSCTTRNGCALTASIMATSILPLPLSTFAWLQPSKDWPPAGCATSMPHCASSSSASLPTKSQPWSFL